MKKYLIIIFCVLSVQSFSQLDLGPRVGLGTVFTNIESTSNDIESGDADFGFSIGAFARIGGPKFKVMPELLYSTSTTNINFEDENGVDQVMESELNQIDVPINLIMKPVGFLSLQGGLIGSILVDSEDKIGDRTEEAFKNYKDFTFGFQAGAGLELGNFLIDLRYEGNLSNISESDSALGIPFDERKNMVKASLGISLF